MVEIRLIIDFAISLQLILACGESGIMTRLKLVKGSIGEDIENNGMSHGIKFILEAIVSSKNSNRISCADSCSQHMNAYKLLHKIGLQFFSVAKIANAKFIMDFLGNKKLENRGDMFDLTRVKESDDEHDLLPFYGQIKM